MDLFEMFSANSRNSFRTLAAYETIDNGDSYDFEFDEVSNSGVGVESYDFEAVA
ncbi:MAG: hypothetical protein ACYDBP_07215 [Leptospirales bacterium]